MGWLATLLAVLANVGLYILIGVTRCMLGGRISSIAAASILIVALISISAWASGYSLQYFNVSATFVAALFVVGLFWITKRPESSAEP